VSRENRLGWWAWAALALAALLCAAFVWPTPYRYDHFTAGGTSLPVRIHRITGRAEILRLNGWEPLEPAAHP